MALYDSGVRHPGRGRYPGRNPSVRHNLPAIWLEVVKNSDSFGIESDRAWPGLWELDAALALDVKTVWHNASRFLSFHVVMRSR